MIERQSDRVPVRWTIRYERLSTDRWSSPQEAVCLNVGGYGMLLLLDVVPKKNEILRLHMRDVNRGLPFTLAQVRWRKSEALTMGAPVMVGIEYVEALEAVRPGNMKASWPFTAELLPSVLGSTFIIRLSLGVGVRDTWLERKNPGNIRADAHAGRHHKNPHTRAG
jgi:hypothetical protein